MLKCIYYFIFLCLWRPSLGPSGGLLQRALLLFIVKINKLLVKIILKAIVTRPPSEKFYQSRFIQSCESWSQKSDRKKVVTKKWPQRNKIWSYMKLHARTHTRSNKFALLTGKYYLHLPKILVYYYLFYSYSIVLIKIEIKN